MTIYDFWYILTMSNASIPSVSLRQRLSRILQSFSLSTVS